MLRKFLYLTALGLTFLTSTVFAQTTPTVQFVGRHLQVNGQPFFIRAVNDSLFPINTFPTGNGICYWDPTSATSFTCPWFNALTPPTVYDFDFVVNYELQLTSQLLANTYRTFNKVTIFPSVLLQRANQYNVKVIAGYWIDYNIDFTFPGFAGAAQRAQIIANFVAYVNQLKTDPNYSAVLMIGLSNENNIHFCEWATSALPICVACDPNAQALGFYQLVDAMAAAAKAGDPDPRPIIVVSAELGDIGNATRGAHDAGVPNIDGWGVNAYRGNSFGNLFATYASLSQKPLVITEFGVDAWNRNPTLASLTGSEDQATQAQWLGLLWDEIRNDYLLPTGSVVAGGAVFQLADNWWQGQGDVWTIGVAQHTPVGWTGPAPDGKFDPEFFGLCDRQPGGTLFVDNYVPRQAATTMYNKFSLGP